MHLVGECLFGGWNSLKIWSAKKRCLASILTGTLAKKKLKQLIDI